MVLGIDMKRDTWIVAHSFLSHKLVKLLGIHSIIDKILFILHCWQWSKVIVSNHWWMCLGQSYVHCRTKSEQSQKIGCSRPGWDDTFCIRDSAEELGLSLLWGVEGHDGGNVAAAVAVVRRRPHRHQFVIEHVLVAFMDKLMCSAYQPQVVHHHKLKKVIPSHEYY